MVTLVDATEVVAASESGAAAASPKTKKNEDDGDNDNGSDHRENDEEEEDAVTVVNEDDAGSIVGDSAPPSPALQRDHFFKRQTRSTTRNRITNDLSAEVEGGGKSMAMVATSLGLDLPTTTTIADSDGTNVNATVIAPAQSVAVAPAVSAIAALLSLAQSPMNEKQQQQQQVGRVSVSGTVNKSASEIASADGNGNIQSNSASKESLTNTNKDGGTSSTSEEQAVAHAHEKLPGEDEIKGGEDRSEKEKEVIAEKLHPQQQQQEEVPVPLVTQNSKESDTANSNTSCADASAASAVAVAPAGGGGDDNEMMAENTGHNNINGHQKEGDEDNAKATAALNEMDALTKAAASSASHVGRTRSATSSRGSGPPPSSSAFHPTSHPNNSFLVSPRNVVIRIKKPSPTSQLGIGLSTTTNAAKVFSISSTGIFAHTALRVGMVVKFVNSVGCHNAKSCAALLKAVREDLTIVAGWDVKDIAGCDNRGALDVNVERSVAVSSKEMAEQTATAAATSAVTSTATCSLTAISEVESSAHVHALPNVFNRNSIQVEESGSNGHKKMKNVKGNNHTVPKLGESIKIHRSISKEILEKGRSRSCNPKATSTTTTTIANKDKNVDQKRGGARKTPKKICNWEGCIREARRIGGFCEPHFHESAGTKPLTCAVEGCTCVAHKKGGFCKEHLKEVAAVAAVPGNAKCTNTKGVKEGSRAKTRKICNAEGCKSVAYRKGGLCAKHYNAAVKAECAANEVSGHGSSPGLSSGVGAALSANAQGNSINAEYGNTAENIGVDRQKGRDVEQIAENFNAKSHGSSENSNSQHQSLEKSKLSHDAEVNNQNCSRSGTKDCPVEIGSSDDEEQPMVELSDTEDKRGKNGQLCKAKGCIKYNLLGTHGFCWTHSRSKPMGARQRRRPNTADETANVDNGQAGKGKAKGIPKQNPQQRSSTPMKDVYLDGDGSDEEDTPIGTLKKQSSKRGHTGRSQMNGSINNNDVIDCLDDDEVQHIFTSPPPAKRTRRSAATRSSMPRSVSVKQKNPAGLRRSKRESTPPLCLQSFPLISSIKDVEKSDVDESDNERDDSTNNIEDESLVEREESRPQLGENTKPKARKSCGYEGCMKFKQNKCEGYCMAHYRDLYVKSCSEDPRTLRVPQDAGPRSSQTMNDEMQELTSNNIDRQEKPFVDSVKPKQGSSAGKQKKPLCNESGCGNIRQSSCDGYCLKHFALVNPAAAEINRQRKRKFPDKPKKLFKSPSISIDNGLKSPSSVIKVPSDNAVAATLTRKGHGGVKKNYKAIVNPNSISKGDELGRGNFTPSSSKAAANGRISSSHTQHHQHHVYQQVGSPVVVKNLLLSPGVSHDEGIGTVTKVYSRSNGVKYDIAYILGGEVKGVDACNVLPSAFSCKEEEAKKDIVKKENHQRCADQYEPDGVKIEEEREDVKFSSNGFKLPTPSSIDAKRWIPRETILDEQLSSLTHAKQSYNSSINANRHDNTQQHYWRCTRCGDLNPPKISKRCGTCKATSRDTSKCATYRQNLRGKPSTTPVSRGSSQSQEDVLLQRTRSELLSGRDYWICTDCVIGIPSLTTPCGGCKKMIDFVPLELEEFEDWVRKQREFKKSEKKRTQQQEMKCWRVDHEEMLRELREGYVSDDKEVEKSGAVNHTTSVTIEHYKLAHRKLFCEYNNCTSFKSSRCQGFCMEHFRKISNTYADRETCYSLVLPSDRELISDMVYLTLEQMIPCTFGLEEKNRLAGKGRLSVKMRSVGFPGLACRHCSSACIHSSQAELPKTCCGNGRWYPASESAMYVTSFMKRLSNHLLNDCKTCPQEVKEKLKLAEDQANTSKSTKEETRGKNKKGNKLLFFHRLWSRVQRTPLGDMESEASDGSSEEGDQCP